MNRRYGFILLAFVSGLVFLSGCQNIPVAVTVPTLTALPAYTEQPTYTVLPTYTALPTLTNTLTPTKTPTSASSKTLSVQATYTPLPTLTKYPTIAPAVGNVWISVTPFITATPQPVTSLNDTFTAGDLSIAITYSNPELAEIITGRTSIGTFLMFRVRLASLSGGDHPPLSSDSFRVLASLKGGEVIYHLDRSTSDYADTRWSNMPNLGSAIPKSGIETYLVFDVNPLSSNYRLRFCPMTEGQSEAAECVVFNFPPVK